MSTTHSSFDQYYFSHKTISHLTAAAPGSEVRRECTVTYFPALPLHATNPGDATVKTDCRVRGRQREINRVLPTMSILHESHNAAACTLFSTRAKNAFFTYARVIKTKYDI